MSVEQALRVADECTVIPIVFDEAGILAYGSVRAYHHREFAKRGWQVIMKDGLPWWVPPPHIDPARTPIRNTVHDALAS